jgi:hypothetical protein
LNARVAALFVKMVIGQKVLHKASGRFKKN